MHTKHSYIIYIYIYIYINISSNYCITFFGLSLEPSAEKTIESLFSFPIPSIQTIAQCFLHLFKTYDFNHKTKLETNRKEKNRQKQKKKK